MSVDISWTALTETVWLVRTDVLLAQATLFARLVKAMPTSTGTCVSAALDSHLMETVTV